MKSITIKAECIKALLHLTSDDPARPAMHGIFLDATRPGETFLVATDGNVLGVIRIEGKSLDKPVSVTIPEGFARLHSGRAKRTKSDVVISLNRGKWHIKSGSDDSSFTPPAEKFYDWRRAIPRMLSGIPSQINPDLLVRMADAYEELGGDRGIGVIVGHNGPTGANIVRLEGIPEFFGLVMPYRSHEQAVAHDWVIREADAGKKGGAA